MATTTRPKSIIAKCMEPRCVINPNAAAALSPGHLLEYTSTQSLGKTDQPKVQKHATAAASKQIIVALENALQGKTTNDAYATADVVEAWIPRRGDRAYMRLANGVTAVQGTSLLTSNADGTLKLYVEAASAAALEMQAIAVALESCDMSGSSGADPTVAGWLLVEFL